MVPIHPAKFNWLYCFLKSIPKSEIENLNFDLVLLFSNEKERIQIARAINNLMPEFIDKIIYLDIQNYIDLYLNNKLLLDRYIKNEQRCIVNLKKFLGLYWAKNIYNYIAVIDCDTVFNHTTKNLFEQLINNYSTKKIFMGGANISDIVCEIQKDSASFFSEEDARKIQKITDNFQAYSWFFEVPFYEKNDLRDFYEFVLLENSHKYDFWSKIGWGSFEHLIYQYYLFLKKNFIFINYGEVCRNVLPETLSYSDLNRIYTKYNYYPTWARFRNLLSSPENYSAGGVSLFYHIDRP